VTNDLLERLQASLGGDYLIERELGGGGMSRLFLAEERRLGRRVVVKVLSPEVAAGLSGERFEREIRVAAELQDPRIVPVLQVGHAGDLRFYTMPYVEGETLRARLDRSPVPVDEALGILRDVAMALERAHAHRVVHRDVKPENILLTGRTAVVADFGIAKAITEAATASSGGTLTTTGALIGTPSYMAPEQASGDAVDARADLYAWGVIAYEMLAGRHPFASRTTVQGMLSAHIVERPAPLAERRPDLPGALTGLVDRCLSKEAAQRPESASALVDQLQEATGVHVQRRRPSPATVAVAAVVVALVAGAGAWLHRRSGERRWAREEALPEATRLEAADLGLAAFRVLRRAARDLPADTQITQALDRDRRVVSVVSSPPGATVEIQDYLTPDSAWYSLGTTPLDSVEVPNGYFRWRVAKAGVGESVTAPGTGRHMKFALDSAVAAPEGMVWVPAQKFWDYIDFVGWVGPVTLSSFDIDRLEVTNREYQKFVDQGGYATRMYWTEPFVRGGHTLTWEQAMALFRDRTGRPGPSTWSGGRFPDGQGDYPVSGVSWYEAAAYAAFVGKSLPTFTQWYETAPGYLGKYIVRESNIGAESPAPVGKFEGLGPFGTYDMAGNVREWTTNAVEADRRFILGGAWASQTYLYADPEALSQFDRSPENGIRCVRNVTPLPPAATKPVKVLERDFTKFVPVGDAVYAAYKAMYTYDKTPLNAKVEGVVQDTPDWREERITLDAAYGNERFAAYLFLPKRVRPPYQTVVFFPSARVVVANIPDSRTLGDVSFFDYVVQSGRAVMYPIYQDTYERRLRKTWPGESEGLEISVDRYKDLGRAIDYLQTRPDIDGSKLAYMGVSMGAAEGVIYATLAQDRLQAVILLDGGFFLDKPPAGADQADFAPRLKKPVLMVNGRYDFTFSLSKSQLPLFRMLGTPASEKQHVALETPHDVRQDHPALVKAVLDFLDTYLGRVQ
jgi:dienelactone hydrolase